MAGTEHGLTGLGRTLLSRMSRSVPYVPAEFLLSHPLLPPYQKNISSSIRFRSMVQFPPSPPLFLVQNFTFYWLNRVTIGTIDVDSIYCWGHSSDYPQF